MTLPLKKTSLKKTMSSRLRTLRPYLASLFAIFVLINAQQAFAEEKLNDTVALAGLKEAKTVFLLDFKDAATTALYLQVVEATHAGFKSQGAKPDIKIVFVGKTVEFLTTKPKPEIAKKDAKSLVEVATAVKNLAKLGVRLQVCGLATAYFKVDNKTIMPGLEMTANGFVSLVGWQHQGYKLVPVF